MPFSDSVSIGYTTQKCGVCTPYNQLVSGSLRDNRKWVGYTGRIHHNFEWCI